MILDTNAVSAWWEGSPAIETLLRQADAVFFPVPVVAEFLFGILKSRHRKLMTQWLDRSLDLCGFLSADLTTARHVASLRLVLQQAGTPIPANDVWIAAIALQFRLPILSNDTHFDLVPGLQRLAF